MLQSYLRDLPFIAILRGITKEEVLPVGDILIEEGIRVIEIPLNSPEPCRSIELLSAKYSSEVLIGAGTVLSKDEIGQVKRAGGSLIVSPNTDSEVIIETKKQNMVSIPGACTPTEIFTAIDAGCDAVKLFPAEIISPAAVKAMRAILPAQLCMLAVGGISMHNIPQYRRMGVNGFGVGSTFYQAGKSLTGIKHDAQGIISAYRQLD